MRRCEQEQSCESQLTELATIFATALLRLHRRAALLEISADSSAEPLDVLPDIRLTVTHGG